MAPERSTQMCVRPAPECCSLCPGIRNRHRHHLPRSKPHRKTLGKRPHAEGHMAYCERRCATCWHQESCPPRFASYLRPVVPSSRRRTRADTIPARPRIGSDDRALPGLQTEIQSCGQRPPRRGGVLRVACPRGRVHSLDPPAPNGFLHPDEHAPAHSALSRWVERVTMGTRPATGNP